MNNPELLAEYERLGQIEADAMLILEMTKADLERERDVLRRMMMLGIIRAIEILCAVTPVYIYVPINKYRDLDLSKNDIDFLEDILSKYR